MENLSPNPAHKGNVKENVMRNFEGFESAVEGILISATLGFSLPLVVAFTEKLAMVPFDTAFLVCIVHSLTATVHAVGNEIGGGKGTKAINHLYYTVASALVGAGLYRCLADSFTVTVDFSSVAAVVIIAATVAVSFAVSAAMTELMENK
jgi:hypothetical protein